MTNPFIEKEERRQSQARAAAIAQRNYSELVKLFRRYTDKDDQTTRERIRRRLQEAKEVADRYS